MPVSAVEHRIRTGLYNCKGVLLLSSTPKSTSQSSKSICNDDQHKRQLCVAMLLTALLLLTHRVYLITVTVLEVVLQQKIVQDSPPVQDVTLSQPVVRIHWTVVATPIWTACHYVTQIRPLFLTVPTLCITVVTLLFIIVYLTKRTTVLKSHLTDNGLVQLSLQCELQVAGYSLSKVVCALIVLSLQAGMITAILLLMSGDVETNPGPTILNIDDHLMPIKEAIWDARPQWRDIGQKLGLKEGDIRAIHEPSDGECLHEVLSMWIHSGKAVIHDLIQVLASQVINRSDIVRKIRSRVGDERIEVGLDPSADGNSQEQYTSPLERMKKALSETPFYRFDHWCGEGEVLYSEAMKKGYVTVQTANVLLFGMAGCGKTSTKHVILGLPPPEKRNSTPLADAAERVHIRKVRDASLTKTQALDAMWKAVTADDLARHVAEVIKSYGKSIPNPPPELVEKLKQLPSEPEENKAQRSVTVPGDISTQKAELAKQVMEVQSMILSHDLESRSSQKVLGSNWIYFVDSGGQPHFHNLLPLFVQGISAAIYVLRLSDRLDDHPLVEYYKDGKPVGEPFTSNLTTAENFKYLVQSIQSHNEECLLVCIGTHLDKVKTCTETLKEKNRRLRQLLPESLVQKCHFNNLSDESLVLPINTHTVGDSRDKVASEIRHVIGNCPSREVKIPVWWYYLEIIIEKTSRQKQTKVLNLDQCKAIASELKFHEDALIEALKFFHKHHIFHYHPDVLPNVVFCDTQVLLDKVTELVEYAAYLRDSTKKASGQGFLLEFRDHGVLTIKLLATFPKHYVEGLFGPSELLKILKKLLVATRFTQSGDCFMPSLLGILPSATIQSLRDQLLAETQLTPLIIRFKNGWPRCGVFCCLQVYLIKECKWKLSSKSKLKQNVAKFLPPYSSPVTLIDSLTYIEVYVESKQLVHHKIRYDVLAGIQSACEALRYENETEDAFMCTCDQSLQLPQSTKQHHLAVVLPDGSSMRCTQSEQCHVLERNHKVWFLDSASPGRDCLSIEYLKARTGVTDKQLDTVISEENVQVLAGCFDSYKQYIDRLGLTSPEKTDLRRIEFLEGHQSAMRDALKFWRKHDPLTATYRELVNMALELRNGVVATDICGYCVENLTV